MRCLHDHRAMIKINRHVPSARAHTHRTALVHLYRRSIGQPQHRMRSARSPQLIAFLQLGARRKQSITRVRDQRSRSVNRLHLGPHPWRNLPICFVHKRARRCQAPATPPSPSPSPMAAQMLCAGITFGADQSTAPEPEWKRRRHTPHSRRCAFTSNDSILGKRACAIRAKQRLQRPRNFRQWPRYPRMQCPAFPPLFQQQQRARPASGSASRIDLIALSSISSWFFIGSPVPSL